ncbi:MAG: hypothetical protein ACOCP4_03130 [Candidatus Woesearchaeota archaeon]
MSDYYDFRVKAEIGGKCSRKHQCGLKCGFKLAFSYKKSTWYSHGFDSISELDAIVNKISSLKGQLKEVQEDLYSHYKQEGDEYILSVIENMSLDDVANLISQSEADYNVRDKEFWIKIIDEFEETYLQPKTESCIQPG